MHICNFCKKTQDEVPRIIVLDDNAICNECILLCTEILIEDTRKELNDINFNKKKNKKRFWK